MDFYTFLDEESVCIYEKNDCIDEENDCIDKSIKKKLNAGVYFFEFFKKTKVKIMKNKIEMKMKIKSILKVF